MLRAWLARNVLGVLLAGGIVFGVGHSAWAGAIGGDSALEFRTELLSMDLNVASVAMPLGPGWTPISTAIHIGLSQTIPSLGQATAFPPELEAAFADAGNGGQQYFVRSFFDVFFDISVTDVDTLVNFGGGPTDGMSLLFPDNGPARMENSYFATYDQNAPNFGLIPPPEASPYIGHFDIEIPLGADLNGNGENDKIKFTLVTHTVQGENRTFITLPDGTVIDTFDSTADLSGAVVDLSQDPPFGPITLTGPTTASSRLVTPEPGTLLLLGAGLVAIGARAWRRPRT